MIYNLTNLSGDEIALIGDALDCLPYGKVHVLIAKLQQQIAMQERNASGMRESQIRADEREKIAHKSKPARRTKAQLPNTEG